MRTRAGIILIEDNNVALIERHRAGLHNFVFPGGGVHEGESPEQAATRETMEELGLQVVIKYKVAEVHLGRKADKFISWWNKLAESLGQAQVKNTQIQIQKFRTRAITFQSGCQLTSCHNMRKYFLWVSRNLS